MANQEFVSAFSNTQGDPTAGESIRHAPNDQPGACVRGNGKQNVQSLFLTPDGEIFHVATGYLSGNDLLNEMRFARDLFGKLQRQSESQEREELVVNSHKRRLEVEGFSQEQINSRPGTELFSMVRDMGNNSSTPLANRQNGGVPNVFESFIRNQFLADNKFSMARPLMNAEDFERNPASLVGNGKSFFASSSSGNQQGEGMPANAMMQNMMNQLRNQNFNGMNGRGPLQGSGFRR